jgi:hypothetical protein
MKIIIAPHPDDEVIGCSRILDSRTHVIFIKDKGWDEARLAETRALAATHPYHFTQAPIFGGYDFLLELIQSFLDRPGPNETTCIFAPDPVWETHPLHVEIGSFVRTLCKGTAYRFFSYTTNMRAPYVEELSLQDRFKKKEMLDFYKSQSDLWKYDHRYFLFEGIAEWNPIVD